MVIAGMHAELKRNHGRVTTRASRPRLISLQRIEKTAESLSCTMSLQSVSNWV